jgi:alkaline phosphatase D
MAELTVSRRQVLTSAVLAAGAVTLTGPATSAAAAHAAETAEPFLLGVASGDPTPSSVILWTRLLRDRYDAHSMPPRPVPVSWQVALDEKFRQVVRQGHTLAYPELAHSVHVDAGPAFVAYRCPGV